MSTDSVLDVLCVVDHSQFFHLLHIMYPVHTLEFLPRVHMTMMLYALKWAQIQLWKVEAAFPDVENEEEHSIPDVPYFHCWVERNVLGK